MIEICNIERMINIVIKRKNRIKNGTKCYRRVRGRKKRENKNKEVSERQRTRRTGRRVIKEFYILVRLSVCQSVRSYVKNTGCLTAIFVSILRIIYFQIVKK